MHHKFITKLHLISMFIVAHKSLLAFYLHLSSAFNFGNNVEIYRAGTSHFSLIQTTIYIDVIDYVSLKVITDAASDGTIFVVSNYTIENTFINEYRLPSLQAFPPGDLDESMRITISKIITVCPPLFVVSVHCIPAIINGAILRFKPFSPAHYFVSWLGARERKECLKFSLMNLD